MRTPHCRPAGPGTSSFAGAPGRWWVYFVACLVKGPPIYTRHLPPPLTCPAGKPTYSIVYNNGTVANLTSNTASPGAGGFAIFPPGGCAGGPAWLGRHVVAPGTLLAISFVCARRAALLCCRHSSLPNRTTHMRISLNPNPPPPPPCRPSPRHSERGLLHCRGAGGVPGARPRCLLLPPLRGARAPTSGCSAPVPWPVGSPVV